MNSPVLPICLGCCEDITHGNPLSVTGISEIRCRQTRMLYRTRFEHFTAFCSGQCLSDYIMRVGEKILPEFQNDSDNEPDRQTV